MSCICHGAEVTCLKEHLEEEPCVLEPCPRCSRKPSENAWDRWNNYSYRWTDQYIFEHGHRGPIEEVLISPETWRELAITWDFPAHPGCWVDEDGLICLYEPRVPIEFGRFTLRRQHDPRGALAHRHWWTPDSPLPGEDAS